jgi:pilus assembly protein CpaC
VPGAALSLPTDRIRPPTQGELFLRGRTGASTLTGAAAEVARQDFQGSYGYVMD